MVESPTFKLPRLGRLGRRGLSAFGGQERVLDRIDLDT